MKKAIRLTAVVLCLVMVASSLYGCTIRINVTVDNQAVPAANTVTPTSATTQATVAQTTPATTAAPTDPAPSDPNGTGADSEAADTADDAGTEATAAPAENAVPTTKEEIVAEYIKVYNATKATGTFLGKDSMTCESIVVDGSENNTLRNLAGKFLAANGTDMPLPPYSDDNPANECLITAADVQEATYVDNGDGTATIKITPIETTNDKKFQGAQGKMFNVMEDVASALSSVPVVSWSEGDANSNVTLITKEGYAEVTYNKDTKIMTKADYVLVTYADIVHCNVLMFKDKSAMAKFVYTTSFPQ